MKASRLSEKEFWFDVNLYVKTSAYKELNYLKWFLVLSPDILEQWLIP